MAIERLAGEDEIMLWADELWPQDIGALVTLDGAGLYDSHGRLRIDDLRAVIASRLQLLPRFRQLLYVPPKEQGGPLWVDAPAFDLNQHVEVRSLPAPGGEAELLKVVEEFARGGLDRSRPLWQMWFLTGLAGGRVGWLVKVHHCIADGIAGVATFGSFLDATADAVPAPPQPWTPAPAPTVAELVADQRRRRRRRRRRALSRLVHPVTNARQLAAAWPAMRELFAEPALPPTSLTRPFGRDRRVAIVRGRLDAVKAIAHAGGGTVNDVLLAAIAGGLRDLLRSRGEAVDGSVLRVYVPVTLRPPEERAQARGNQIAQMTVPLPIGDMNPVERLRQIGAETARRKARTRPSIGKVPHHGFAGRMLLKLIDRQRVNLTTADLPGPPIPLYFTGARVLEVFPLLPLIGTVSLGIGALSYAGQFNITAVGDGEGYPDLEVFAIGLREELAAMASAGPTAASNPVLRHWQRLPVGESIRAGGDI
jgi:diacylglycerol O-acyltransferase / wax synthase